MPVWSRWVLAVLLAVLVVAPPFVLYRADYVTAKRFREVTPGRFYRSGQMTASGLEDVLLRYKIKTVINLQHEDGRRDPLLCNTWVQNWFGGRTTPESEICERQNARYVLIEADVVPDPNDMTSQPPGVTEFLKILDDESSYPVLIHCLAGLHRTGRLTAIYRMEYEGWGLTEAVRELRANGYGYDKTHDADKMLVQFVQNFKPRAKGAPTRSLVGVIPVGGK